MKERLTDGTSKFISTPGVEQKITAGTVQRDFTLFCPISTKTQHLLVSDMKGELQAMNNQISNLPIDDFRKEQNQRAETLKERMEALEQGFVELREVIIQRTINNFKCDPELLKLWDPNILVIQKSHWTNMRLILNKVAEDNLPNLFPNDWFHQKLFSQMQEMQFKVVSEMMTTIFQQCGILLENDIIEMQNYELFLKKFCITI